MPSADELTPAQTRRRTLVLDVLTAAGWVPDTALWDAGISTDFVAGAQLRGAGTARRCDYMITARGDLTEYLHVRWNPPDGDGELIIDFLGQSSGGPETDLAEVLAALTSAQAREADRPEATAAALPPGCPRFVLDGDGLLAPLDREPGEETEVVYLDQVENRLHQELRQAGWKRTPVEMATVNGPMTLAVGRWNGTETVVRLESDEGYARLRVDDLARPQDADRLVALLLDWQARITRDNWQDFVRDLLAAYPKVRAEGAGDDEWHPLSRPGERPVLEPRPGAADRTRLIRDALGGAGWSQTDGPDGAYALCMTLRTRSGALLDCIHSLDPPEAVLLGVRLAEGESGPFGDRPTFALDVLDLWSGRGGRDRTADVLDVLTAPEHALDARGLMPLVQALQLRCPVFLVRDGALATITRTLPEYGGEPVPPLPRPLGEMDRVVGTPEGDTAGTWCERGHAALAEHRFDLALESFDAAIERDPDHAPAHYHRAGVIGAGHLEEAHRAYYRSVELDYAVGPSLLHYAALMYQCGYHEQETETLRHATQRLPEYGPGWYELSLTAVKAGRYDECVTAATEALRLMPRDARTLHCRACGHALRGDTAEALADIAAALEADASLRSEMRDDPDFGALREDPRFAELVDPWPAPGEGDGTSMPSALIEVLRPAGWRPDDLAVSAGRITSVEYPCPAGRLIFGLSAGTCYVNLRPRGRGEDAEGWLYTGPGEEARALAELLTGWQDRLDGDNFAEFADEVLSRLPTATWHRGHP